MQTIAGSLENPPHEEIPSITGMRGYLLAAGSVAAALVCRLAVDRQWGEQMPYPTFFLAAVVCTSLTGVGPSLFSILAGLVLANWFFISPRHSLEWGTPERMVLGCMYTANLGIVLAFVSWARKALESERNKSLALARRTGELESSEKRFQILAEAAFEGILMSQDGRIVDCNNQLAALVGYSREELAGKLATDFIAPEERGKVQRNIREQLPAAYELELLCKSGERRTVEAHGRPMRSPDGTTMRVSVVRDVSELKRWEESMRRRTEELERLMDTLPAAVWMAHDPECKTITGNRAANALMRVTAGTNVSLNGSGAGDMVKHFKADGTEYPLEQLPLQRAAATGLAVANGEVELRFSDGRRAWMLGSAEPLFDAEGVCRGAVGAFVDETERKLAEQALLATRDELALANERLEARVAERTRSLEEKANELNAFCYSLAHDFRAPLRTQEGFARILIEDYGEKLGETGTSLARRVLRAAQRQGDIIQDLLAHISVTRSELPVEKLNLRDSLEQARADLALEFQDKRAQIYDEKVADSNLVGNRSSLHLILLNLLTNAFKFVAPDTIPVVRLRTEQRGGFVRLWVEDNGIGIPPEDIGKLFSMFRRLNPSAYPGTGMGLAIVKQAAERMGGRVGVESEPGKGSRFWVEMKAATD